LENSEIEKLIHKSLNFSREEKRKKAKNCEDNSKKEEIKDNENEESYEISDEEEERIKKIFVK